MRRFLAMLTVVLVYGVTSGSVAWQGAVKPDSLGVLLSPNRVDTVMVSPDSLTLEIGDSGLVTASAKNQWGSNVKTPVVWTARDTTLIRLVDIASRTVTAVAKDKVGSTWVVGSIGNLKDSAKVTNILTATITAVAISPTQAALAAGGTRQFTASATWSDGKPHPFTAVWTANGGTITQAGLYTAGQVGGAYQVTATAGGKSATAQVTVAAAATIANLSVTPATAALSVSATQTFVGTATWTDGGTYPYTVSWTATGGTITSGGLYTAGATLGTYRVIGTAGGKADTSSVTITATPTGRTFFVTGAESGNLSDWAPLPWGVIQFNGTVTTSTTKAHSGTRSYKYEVTSSGNPPESPSVGHAVQTLSGGPTTLMGNPNGYYTTGYYSFWAYVDAGYDAPGWNMLLGWMTGTPVNPATNIGLEYRNGVLQLMFQLKNASGACGACYTAPTISGYSMQSNGWYYQTAQSPAGIKAFPRQQWVRVSIYYKMAASNGQVTIWQDGVKVMDLAAPTLNTFIGETTRQNTSGGMLLQFGNYGGAQLGRVQRLYVDDFTVTDFLP